jgi:hypothetical protein
VRPSGDRAVAAPPEPAGAYLRSLTVSGFRGIGKPATLSLQPGPGPTVVVGRNGIGKSGRAWRARQRGVHLAGWDDSDEVSGRGWAALDDDGSLQGHLYFHLGDDSGFRAVRFGQEPEIAPSSRPAQ